MTLKAQLEEAIDAYYRSGGGDPSGIISILDRMMPTWTKVWGLPTIDDVRDVFQEVRFGVFKLLSSHRPPEDIAGMVKGIFRKKRSDVLRKYYESEVTVVSLDAVVDGKRTVPEPDAEEGGYSDVEVREAIAVWRDVIARTRTRTPWAFDAFLMHELEDLEYKEICRRLEPRYGTLKDSFVAQQVKRVRDHLERDATRRAHG